MLFVLAGLCAAHDSVHQRLSELADEIEALVPSAKHQVARSAEQQDFERRTSKTAVVDVHICAAIPILEKVAGHCSKDYIDMQDRPACVKRAISAVPNIGGSGGDAERILLSQLLGVLSLSSGALTPTEKLVAFDWMAKSLDAPFLDTFMPSSKSVSQSYQENVETVTNTLVCMADIGTTVATMGVFERNVVKSHGSTESEAKVGESPDMQTSQDDSELKREAGEYTVQRDAERVKGATCIKLLVKLAQLVARANGKSWSASDLWRVKGAVEMQKGALDETQALLDDLPFPVSQSTLMAVKQILCVLTLYDAHFAYKDAKDITVPRPTDSGTEMPYPAGKYKRKLELARVDHGLLGASVTAYRKNEEIELVQDMLDELEKLYMVLTQAILREGMRLNIQTQKLIVNKKNVAREEDEDEDDKDDEDDKEHEDEDEEVDADEDEA